MTDTPFVSGLVLAAGRGERLGRTKPLVEVGGKPLVRHAVDALAESVVDEVVVVVGWDAAAVRRALSGAEVRVVENPEFGQGQSTSLRAGLSAVDGRSEGVVVLLADQPGVRAATVDRVVSSWREQGGAAARAVYVGGGSPVEAHPVLLSRQLWPELQAIEGDRGARQVLQRHHDDVLLVHIDEEAPVDVDTATDLAALLADD